MRLFCYFFISANLLLGLSDAIFEGLSLNDISSTIVTNVPLAKNAATVKTTNEFIFTQAYNNTQIYTNTLVYNNEQVYNNTQAYDTTQVYNTTTQVYNTTTQVYNTTQAYDTTKVYSITQAYDTRQVYSVTEVYSIYDVFKIVSDKRLKEGLGLYLWKTAFALLITVVLPIEIWLSTYSCYKFKCWGSKLSRNPYCLIFKVDRQDADRPYDVVENSRQCYTVTMYIAHRLLDIQGSCSHDA